MPAPILTPDVELSLQDRNIVRPRRPRRRRRPQSEVSSASSRRRRRSNAAEQRGRRPGILRRIAARGARGLARVLRGRDGRRR